MVSINPTCLMREIIVREETFTCPERRGKTEDELKDMDSYCLFAPETCNHYRKSLRRLYQDTIHQGDLK